MNRCLCGQLASLLLALSSTLVSAGEVGDRGEGVTFYRDVLPILQENCQVCHRPSGAIVGGMQAPMSLVSYAETRPWARSMARNVEARKMPPWHASPNQAGVFANERSLSLSEISTIVRWATTGAVAGDPADAPEPLVFETDWLIGEPDLVVEMPEAFPVEDEVDDLYVRFETRVTEEMLPEPRWVQAVEFRPGSPAVHHLVAPPLGGMAMGSGPTIIGEGYGRLLEPNAVVQWKMHYHKEPGPDTAVVDRSKVAVRFFPRDYSPRHVIQSASMSNRWFEIPAGAASYSNTISYTFERDSRIVSLKPHAHLRGKSALYVAHYPDGTREALLEVPRYDFNWQTTYLFREEPFMPAGSKLALTMVWDNSAANPANPDPTVDVGHGRSTTDEMMEGYLEFTDAVPGYLPKTDPRGADGPWTLQELLHQRLGTDLDSLCAEDRQRLMEYLSRSTPENSTQGVKSQGSRRPAEHR